MSTSSDQEECKDDNSLPQSLSDQNHSSDLGGMDVAIPKKISSPRSVDKGFLHYLREIQKFPILTQEEETKYGKRFADEGDKEAGKILVQSHLRLVVKMAGKFRNYGLPFVDLVSEGNLGLIQAVKKFDPRKGFRLSTYAMWWIRAYIQDYVLRSWSLVKMSSSAAQKKLFFNLHKIKKRLNLSGDPGDKNPFNNGTILPEHVSRIASDLNVSEKDVIEMDSRLTQPDHSLNSKVGDEDGDKEALDFLVADQASQEQIAIENQQELRKKLAFKKAFDMLNEREKDILIKRQIAEELMTLEELSQIYKISRERIRQIEENAIKKIKKAVDKLGDTL